MGKEVIFTDEAFDAETEMNSTETAEFHRIVQMLEEQGCLQAPYAEKIAGHANLFAIRIKKGGNCRVFYAYDDGVSVWLLNGYEKKTEDIPHREVRRAIRLKRKYGL